MLNYTNINKLLPINVRMKYNINSKEKLAMFLAQCDHESQGFTRVRENLNYSKEALLKLVDKNGDNYFTEEEAECYGRTQHHPANQEMIANIFYANRMGNSDVYSEDGWNYRGGGWIQVTGKNNYSIAGKAIGVDLLNNPALICQPQNAMAASLWFWNTNHCNDFVNNIEKVTKIINGGLNGIDSRNELYKQYLGILKNAT